jgi:hypothetical protein
MKKFLHRIKSRKGFSAPWVVVVALIGVMLFVVISQYIRLMTIAAGVKDAVQSAVISASVSNWANVYPCIREGYAGGYRYSNGSWNERMTTGNIYGRLSALLGLRYSNGKYWSVSSEGGEYAVYGLNVHIDNSPFAPGNTNGIQEFQATSRITLEVPLSFGSDILPPMTINLVVKSRYMPKF